MQTLSEIRALLSRRGIRPKHRLGQNFLHDHNQIRKLVDAGLAGEADGARRLVLEVGPGTGALTEALVERGCEVIACEIDRDMIAILRERFGDRVTIVEGDVLASKHAIHPAVSGALAGRDFKLIANLPYQIATPLIMNLLLDVATCRGQFVTIQKEVADRLLAKPGTKEYGPLSIVAQVFARIEPIGVVPPSCFWPEPEVTSAMVAVTPEWHAGAETRTHGAGDRRAFARFVTNLFTKRRKQLGSIFGRDRALPAGIDPSWRPETLAPQQVVQLHEWMQRPRSA
jgi:16S rRNA (adenine1518-N6/adenine1519-N6)-dimethyltransferase